VDEEEEALSCSALSTAATPPTARSPSRTWPLRQRRAA
jgi:hypothetical protein